MKYFNQVIWSPGWDFNPGPPSMKQEWQTINCTLCYHCAHNMSMLQMWHQPRCILSETPFPFQSP